MSVKVLVVDDEVKIARMIEDYLGSLGYEVVLAGNGKSALEKNRGENPDCIVLDIMMPELDGYDVMKRLRQDSHVPVIMLTARAREADKLMGLELGADDYVTKPFSLKELEARIRTVLRRAGGRYGVSESGEKNGQERIEYRDIIIDPEKMSLRKSGREVNLTTAQFKICAELFSNPGRVFSRMDLLKTFQNSAFEGYERTIDVHIKNIRKALETDPSHPEYIRTVWGAGYKVPDLPEGGGKR